MKATFVPSRTSTSSTPPMCALILAIQAMRVVITSHATEQVSSAVESNSSHVSCYDATRSPPSAGTYSEYNITTTSFVSDVCDSTSLYATFQRNKKVCDDEYPYDDDYYADDDFALRASNSTRYSKYCLMANRAPSSTPSSRPSYGIGSPTPAPTKFKGVKFSASQVKSSISVCLLVIR